MKNYTPNGTLCGVLFAAMLMMTANISADPSDNPLAPSQPQESMTTDSVNTIIPSANDTDSVDGTGRGLLRDPVNQATIDSVDGTGHLAEASHGTDSVDGTGRRINTAQGTHSVDGTGIARSIISTLAAPVAGDTLQNADSADCDQSSSTQSNSTANDDCVSQSEIDNE